VIPDGDRIYYVPDDPRTHAHAGRSRVNAAVDADRIHYVTR
jgi:hypothetical protein